MDIPSHTLRLVLEILVLEFDSRLAGVRYDEKVQTQGEKCDEGRGEYVRNHHPMETDTTGKYGDYLGVGGHLRGEEYDRNEHEQRTEHVHEVRNEVEIVVEDDSPERSLLLDKVIDSLADIEDDDDADYQKQRYDEGAYELTDDV